MRRITAYPRISPEKSVRQGNAKIKTNGSQDFHFCLDQLVSFVGVVTDVEEIIKYWWASLLQDNKVTHQAL